MDKREKGGFSPPALGGSSLLVIFAVLALTVFALLSLSTVRADTRLADASAKAVEDYYAADCQAQEILARLRNGERPEGVEEEEPISNIFRYTVPISDTQELQVEVWKYSDVESEQGEYRILRWQAAPIGEWSPDEGLDLWVGE